MIRTRRALRAEIADLRTALNESRAATRAARDRATQHEAERDVYRDELDDAERRARAWRALYRAAAATRDDLAAAITGEHPTPAVDQLAAVRKAVGAP